ncbi:MAG: radical SAM family heme chaperone HemW [Oscillibacter sp.]|nr:radical SAM family heme chaperone HemW [Oscillibacter sp.]
MRTPLRPLGLYIHIPFCRQKCAYCDFYSLSGQEGRMDDYTAALCTHLAETASAASCHTVDTVYFGGGTPSLLGEKRLVKIFKTIQKKYRLAKDPEITLEANPESAGDWKTLRALRRAGFNRLSLGMQSAGSQNLLTLGRIHTAAETRAAVEAARKAGFDNLSLDLIYGLPGQTLEHWQEDLAAAEDLVPEHLSCYGLQVEEGTPLHARRDTLDLPGDGAQAEMYLWTVEDLARHGYRQYEISNFAKPGRESRHNLKYWTLAEYAGFGPSAHSDFGDTRYAYGRDLEGYIRGVREHAPLLSESERIPALERDTEWIMLRCRTAEGLDPKEFERRFRRRFSCLAAVLAACRDAGYAVEEPDGRWHLTPQGFLLSNQIIGRLLDALTEEKRRRAEAAARGDFRVVLE